MKNSKKLIASALSIASVVTPVIGSTVPSVSAFAKSTKKKSSKKNSSSKSSSQKKKKSQNSSHNQKQVHSSYKGYKTGSNHSRTSSKNSVQSPYLVNHSSSTKKHGSNYSSSSSSNGKGRGSSFGSGTGGIVVTQKTANALGKMKKGQSLTANGLTYTCTGTYKNSKGQTYKTFRVSDSAKRTVTIRIRVK